MGIHRTLFLLFFLGIGWISAQTPKLRFEGNSKFDRASLQEVIEKEWGEYQKHESLKFIDDASYKLMLHYRFKGHSFAEVDYEVKEGEVIFKIDEHKTVLMQKIEIVSSEEGKALAFSDQKLKTFLTPPKVLEEHFLDRRVLNQDKEAIANFYRSEGYLEVKVDVSYRFIPDPPDSTSVQAKITVEEGPRFYLASISIEGNKSFSEKALLPSPASGRKVFTPGLEIEWKDRLQDFYRMRGYAQMRLRVSMQEETDPSDPHKRLRHLLFQIEEGEIHIISEITILGNEDTQEDVIRRQLDLGVGDRYDISKIISSRENIQATGLFLQTEIEEKIVGQNTVALRISVEERKNKTVTFRLGYTTSYGILGGIEFEHINIFGTNRQFIASVDSTLVSSALSKREAKIQLIDPQFFGSRTWLSRVQASVSMEETPTYTAFERGASITFEKKLSEVLTGELGYGVLWSQILDIVDGADADLQEGTTFLSFFTEKITLNLRDDEGYPTSGSYHFIEMQESSQAIGSDVNYFSIYGHTAWYFRVIERCVLSFALRGGVIIPFGGTDVIPIQKRFFAGGATSVRSFPEKEMPPWDEKDRPTGGEGIFLAS